MVHIKIVKIINYLDIAITNQSKEKVGGCGLKVRQKGPKKPSPSLSTPRCTHAPYLLIASIAAAHLLTSHFVSTAARLLPSISAARRLPFSSALGA